MGPCSPVLSTQSQSQSHQGSDGYVCARLHGAGGRLCPQLLYGSHFLTGPSHLGRPLTASFSFSLLKLRRAGQTQLCGLMAVVVSALAPCSQQALSVDQNIPENRRCANTRLEKLSPARAGRDRAAMQCTWEAGDGQKGPTGVRVGPPVARTGDTGQRQCHSVLRLDQAGWGPLEHGRHEMRGRALWGQTLPNAEGGSGMALGGGTFLTHSSSAC